MNILIAGATGLVGRYLCHKLRNHNIYQISHSSVDFSLSIDKRKKLLSAFKSKPIDVIIHLANPPDWNNPKLSYYVPTNVLGTLNLIELAQQKQAQFIFTSSQMIYGAHDTRRSLAEATPPQPTDWYGLSKFIAEQFLSLHHRQTGLPVIILRPVGIFGKGDTRTLLGKFISQAKKNKSITLLGRGLTKRHYIHVDDMVKAIIGSLSIKKGLHVFNLGSSKVVSNLKLAQFISRSLSISIIHRGREIRRDFYVSTRRQQRDLHLKPDLFVRIKQELSVQS